MRSTGLQVTRQDSGKTRRRRHGIVYKVYKVRDTGLPRGSSRPTSLFRLSVSTRLTQAWPSHQGSCHVDVRFKRAGSRVQKLFCFQSVISWLPFVDAFHDSCLRLSAKAWRFSLTFSALRRLHPLDEVHPFTPHIDLDISAVLLHNRCVVDEVRRVKIYWGPNTQKPLPRGSYNG
jgi:hypothetical protein